MDLFIFGRTAFASLLTVVLVLGNPRRVVILSALVRCLPPRTPHGLGFFLQPHVAAVFRSSLHSFLTSDRWLGIPVTSQSIARWTSCFKLFSENLPSETRRGTVSIPHIETTRCSQHLGNALLATCRASDEVGAVGGAALAVRTEPSACDHGEHPDPGDYLLGTASSTLPAVAQQIAKNVLRNSIAFGFAVGFAATPPSIRSVMRRGPKLRSDVGSTSGAEHSANLETGTCIGHMCSPSRHLPLLTGCPLVTSRDSSLYLNAYRLQTVSDRVVRVPALEAQRGTNNGPGDGEPRNHRPLYPAITPAKSRGVNWIGDLCGSSRVDRMRFGSRRLRARTAGVVDPTRARVFRVSAGSSEPRSGEENPGRPSVALCC
ncbi:hypothetical protein K466DRAFT_115346 [Polyporus arcularius HHB13444]|uniref:Uncharacterized protein n=1 Tax=Polyporus arcularius HHB13444 TaxID=1314778 RepID=A0A5C3PDE5_9APHY|nr:hypothetical protein K466DRAFT_115346 [Polyporus arcularius HHB13444]